MTSFAAFLLGVAAIPGVWLCIELVKQLHDLWCGLDYYDQPENVDNLTWFGKAVARLLRALKRCIQ